MNGFKHRKQTTIADLEGILDSIWEKISTLEGELFQEMRAEISKLRESLADFKKTHDTIITARDRLLDSLRERQRDIEELNANFQKLLSKYLALKNPPLGIVTFIRFVRMEKIPLPDGREIEYPLLEVRDHRGDYGFVTFIHETQDPKTFTFGQQLLVIGGNGLHNAIEALPEHSYIYAEGVVDEVLVDDQKGPRYLISATEGREKVIGQARGGVAGIEAGSRVLFDARTGIIVEIIPHKGERNVIEEITVTFDDIGGYKEIKERVRKRFIRPLFYQDIYRKIRRPFSRGCVLAGGPGLGKTMLAKAIFHEMCEAISQKTGKSIKALSNHFIHVRGPELLDKFVGETERRIREKFERAKKIATSEAPVVIFWDEAESFLPLRGSGISSDVEKTNVTMFTTLVDGLEESGHIINILATNRFDLIDPAVVRSGRCDFIIRMIRPNRVMAADIFPKHLHPSWDEINPKYNVSVYIPTDRKGKPRKDSRQQTVSYSINFDPQKALDYLIGKTVARMYDEKDPRNMFLRVKYHGEKTPTIYRYGDFASGAVIANIVERAKDAASDRHIDSKEAHEAARARMLEECEAGLREAVDESALPAIEPLGVTLGDLLNAVEAAYSEIRHASSTREFLSWFSMQGYGESKLVEDFKFLDEGATMDEDEEFA